MQEKVGKAIDKCEDADQEEELIDLYNNIQFEREALDKLLDDGQLKFSKHTGVMPDINTITNELPAPITSKVSF
jgi:hypothetical protein